MRAGVMGRIAPAPRRVRDGVGDGALVVPGRLADAADVLVFRSGAEVVER